MSNTTPPPLFAKTVKDPAIELKSASQLYWLYAFLLGIPLGIVIALSENKPDKVGIAILFCLGIYLLLLIFSGVLLLMKKKAGLYLGWILIPFILLSFPIGTIVGVFIITKITKPDVKALLT